MAETVSLAVLENLVHMTKDDFPTGYVVVAAVVPEHVRVLRVEDLPVESRAINRETARRPMDRFVRFGRS